MNPIDAIRLALEREKFAVKSYTEYAAAAREAPIREMFLYLAEEEKKHVRILQDEIDRETKQEM